MTAQRIAERIAERISLLDEENLRAAVAFISFLQYQQHLEEVEDIADAEDRRNEPTYSFEEVKRELGIA